jgi:Flp pilus assembly protein TadD
MILGALGVSVACASSGSFKANAKLEMESGYRAARRGYWQEALLHYEQARQLDPQDPKILNNLAVALEAVGRYDDARKVYEEAIGHAPQDDNLRRNFKFFNEFYDSYLKKKSAREAPVEAEDAGGNAANPREEDGP